MAATATTSIRVIPTRAEPCALARTNSLLSRDMSAVRAQLAHNHHQQTPTRTASVRQAVVPSDESISPPCLHRTDIPGAPSVGKFYMADTSVSSSSTTNWGTAARLFEIKNDHIYNLDDLPSGITVTVDTSGSSVIFTKKVDGIAIGAPTAEVLCARGPRPSSELNILWQTLPPFALFGHNNLGQSFNAWNEGTYAKQATHTICAVAYKVARLLHGHNCC